MNKPLHIIIQYNMTKLSDNKDGRFYGPGDSQEKRGDEFKMRQQLFVATALLAVGAFQPAYADGLLSKPANALASQGIDVSAIYLNQFMANPSTGFNTGTTSSTGALIPHIDVDLNKLAGIPGASIHFEQAIFTFVSGQNMTSNVGGILPGLPYNAVGKHTYLSELTYEQKLLQGRLDIEVGRMNPLRHFSSPNCDNFFTCQDPVFLIDNDVPPYPYGVWGGRAQLQLDKQDNVQLGAFEDDFYDARVTNGYDWGTNHATGAEILFQLARHTSFADSRHPGAYSLMYFHNTSTVPDPYITVAGTSQVFNPSTAPATYTGTDGLVLRFNQTLWSAAAPPGVPPVHTDVYGGVSYSFTASAPVRAQFYTGVNYYFHTGMPLDTLGLKLQYADIGSRELMFQRDARIAAGGADVMGSSNEWRFEVNGSYMLLPGIALQPTFQYYINPDAFFNPFQPRLPRNGMVFGATLVVFLGQILGLPQPPMS